MNGIDKDRLQYGIQAPTFTQNLLEMALGAKELATGISKLALTVGDDDKDLECWKAVLPMVTLKGPMTLF